MSECDLPAWLAILSMLIMLGMGAAMLVLIWMVIVEELRERKRWKGRG